MSSKFILVAILIFLLTACTQQIQYNKQLAKADSLMLAHPDSTLQILNNIATGQFTTKADKAYYALLLTQARDKNYIKQTNDSLIRIAINYFDSVNDTPKQARSYYNWGNIYRDRGEYHTAINRYLTALTYLSRCENNELKSVLYSNLGYLYYVQNLNAEADSIYHQAELLALQQKDTVGFCYALTQQGMINLEKGEAYHSKAERQILQALSLGKSYSDKTVLEPIYVSLSTLYNLIPDTLKALEYSRLSYSIREDTIHCYRTFLMLGNAYFLNAKYDSASVFLHKVFTADRFYDTKANACMLLSEIAQLRGDKDSAFFYEKKRAVYLDSASTYLQGYTTIDRVIPNEQNKDWSFHEHYSYIVYGILCLLITIGTFCIHRLWRKNKQHLAEKKEWEDKLQVGITTLRQNAKELAEQQQQKLQLQDEVNQLVTKKRAYNKEDYKTSPLYVKVSRIAKELVKTDTKENLNEEEWTQFIALTNAGWNEIISYLNENYNLSAEEIQICCLYLAKVPVKHIGHFVKGQVRSTIQSKSKDILLKIEAPQNILLKNALFLLAEKLGDNKLYAL